MPDVYKQTTFELFVLTGLAIIVLIICMWCIYAFVKAIFLFIFSHWDAGKIKQAYSSIRYMIIWVILTVGLLFVFPPLLKAIKLDWADSYTAKNVFSRIWELFNYVINMWDIFSKSQDYMKTNSNLYINIEKPTWGTPSTNYDL